MEVNWMSNVEMKDFVCEQCDLEFTREKDYFDDRLEYCYCCENEEHYVVLGDIRMSDMQETDDGFWVEDVGCKYCEKKLSLEFTFRDNAVLMSEDVATWEGHSVQISFGDAD